ncbi:hypothetical protein H6F86_01965 [Phormidium sp. FACHB-592]|uniref:GNAT family N-acetyltransferase n=1 Tax=Stenomitos frigidus AS-A4 TaxID=2933935 RepID=A0ABV0KJY0_9CYAN|nr:hypothetical protein [Phormidium sp. FACHB-592]MBD2072672.1 hypothetical protein [Phormidium sp. FACHB-592]
MQKVIKLLRVADDRAVDAVLTTLNQKHLDDFETFWKARLQASNEGDRYWNWEKKNRVTASSINYEKYAIECEQITQGLMIVEIDWHRSQIESGKSLVYVDYLAAAPWNRCSSQEPPQFSGVGTILMQFARSRSVALGYGGRVALHALPSAATFYDKQNMMNFGSDPDKENLIYFEWGRIKR